MGDTLETTSIMTNCTRRRDFWRKDSTYFAEVSRRARVRGSMMTSSRLHSSVEAITALGLPPYSEISAGLLCLAESPFRILASPLRNSRLSERRRTIFIL